MTAYPSRSALLYSGLIGSLLTIVSSAQATILTFDFQASGFGSIPSDYGNRVSATEVTGASGLYRYGEGEGFTPNVTISYSPDQFYLYSSGYGDLVNALGHVNYNVVGEIRLTPDSGYEVVLHSFDIAPWLGLTYEPNIVRVLDADDNLLFDSGSVNFASGESKSFPGAPIASSSALRVQVFDYGDLGLDNLSFSQRVVPEPSAIAMAAVAVLLGFGMCRRSEGGILHLL